MLWQTIEEIDTKYEGMYAFVRMLNGDLRFIMLTWDSGICSLTTDSERDKIVSRGLIKFSPTTGELFVDSTHSVEDREIIEREMRKVNENESDA